MSEVAKPGRRQVSQAEQQPEKVAFRAVYGLMVHPFTQTRFEQGVEIVHDEDSWVSAQVGAGKLEKV